MNPAPRLEHGRSQSGFANLRRASRLAVLGVTSALLASACQPERASLDQGSVALPSAIAAAPDITGGIATPETVAEDIGIQTVDAYVPPDPGTVFTWRNNWKSLPPTISYRVEDPVTVGGHRYVKLASIAGLKDTTYAYYDAQDFNLKGYRDAFDKALVTYKPVEERYRFPMKPGDKWVTKWKSKDHRKGDVTSGGGVVQVIGFEELKLPAGQFRAVRIRMPLPAEMAGMRHDIWFAPSLGVTVKEQITNGRMNWTQLLEKVERPG